MTRLVTHDPFAPDVRRAETIRILKRFPLNRIRPIALAGCKTFFALEACGDLQKKKWVPLEQFIKRDDAEAIIKKSRLKKLERKS